MDTSTCTEPTRTHNTAPICTTNEDEPPSLVDLEEQSQVIWLSQLQLYNRAFALAKERYGELGRDFIEAHHLRPISLLEEGTAVSYDIATDFAVLCSNCHRMIHRTTDPSDLEGFRRLIKSS